MDGKTGLTKYIRNLKPSFSIPKKLKQEINQHCKAYTQSAGYHKTNQLTHVVIIYS
ncbi:hypothetical protein HTH_1864 [Hydrogenobacter thermophilus TK-6]|uniref:Uncharacterized protein n=1 Tax=Hydrogenobacter thermophilus (strain DSM 6534 / IAM 12695 / TK-6) TaxID=608538 RepID=D3DKF6_HYDTT|nr:hypothetical protein HTH_1864 [Hydrogenobacter thermophilus TK-6]